MSIREQIAIVIDESLKSVEFHGADQATINLTFSFVIKKGGEVVEPEHSGISAITQETEQDAKRENGN